MFDLLALCALLAVVLVFTGCPPSDPPTFNDEPGQFTVAGSRLLGRDATFSITDELVYAKRDVEGMSNPSLSLPDNELTMVRCTWCHECTFEAAFDWDNYGSTEWSPQYTGTEWAPVVQRMMRKEMSFLQEEKLVERIFEYLRDDTLGVYNVEEDDMGAVRIEVDELPTPVNPEMVVEPEDAPGDGSAEQDA